MNIGVIGIGKLGLSFALLAEKKGLNVIGSDISQKYVDLINNKTLKSLEPNIEHFLNSSKKLKATTSNFEVILNSDLIWTFVQTPSLPDGSYDHSNIENVINDFIKLHNEGVSLVNKTFIIGATTTPTYVNTVVERLKPIGIDVCYNPEFIVQGDIIKGLEMADIVLLGCESELAGKKITNFYEKIMSIYPNIKIMSNTAAEITKISINCFLTTKISFANMVGEVCINSDISNEIGTVLDAIGSDNRIGKKYLNYGYGFGGPCLPRDNRALGFHMDKINLKINLPYEVDKFNKQHNSFLFEQLKKYKKTQTFIFPYVSYKKGIDIITESQQLKLAKTLLENGYKVHIIDNQNVLDLIKDELTKQYGTNVSYSNDYNTEITGILVDYDYM